MIQQPDLRARVQQTVAKMVAQGIHRGVVALGLVECECGASKPRKHAFCRPCYMSLPPELRQALYQRVGNGYEGAYEAAVKRLSETGRIPPAEIEESYEV